MQILDLKKQLKPFYSPSSRAIELVDIPEFQFISINGAIEPGQGPGTSPSSRKICRRCTVPPTP